ncbi:hypothetical protein CJ030_MR6G000794 [Morella rubra]|uniref:Uncharacterized protein n=1 Tax=Morella rubra TaxID=262757 RepID=A0A6A1V7T5_9ROSI|nr:hypothetical protein CJ030_MR6G000794 [Morella rubra]
MEQCRQGKSAKWIRNLGKRIGSEGWARGSQSRTRRLSVDCSSCSRGESGSPRAGRGTDWERSFRRSSPGVEQSTQNGTDKGMYPRLLAPVLLIKQSISKYLFILLCGSSSWMRGLAYVHLRTRSALTFAAPLLLRMWSVRKIYLLCT